MKLIVITRPEYFVVEHLIIKALFNEGLDILHLRKPNGDVALCERLLSLLPEDCRERVMIHDNFELKKKYKLMGIHLNSRNPEIPQGYRGNVSCSCRSLEDLKEAKRGMKYVFLSPVFGNVQKSSSEPPFTSSQLRAASDKNIIDGKVVAMGGVNAENVSQLRELGFGGVAVLGALANRFNPVTSDDFRDMISYFRLLRRATE